MFCIVVALVTIPTIFFATKHFYPPQTIIETPTTPQEETGSTFDDDFFENSSAYTNLLSEDDFAKFQSKIEDIENSEEINKEIQKMNFTYIVNKDSDLKDLLVKANQEVTTKKKDGAYFEQSATCANLTSGIKANIKEEDGTYAYGITNRKFEYMFYSPTLDTCIYTVNKTQYPGSSFEGTTYKEVYNANSQTLINTYKIYGYNDSKSESEAKKSQAEKRLYIKYILENSNYNVDLLRDTDYIYI